MNELSVWFRIAATTLLAYSAIEAVQKAMIFAMEAEDGTFLVGDI